MDSVVSEILDAVSYRHSLNVPIKKIRLRYDALPPEIEMALRSSGEELNMLFGCPLEFMPTDAELLWEVVSDET